MFIKEPQIHVSFHTPAHSGEAYKGRDFFTADITELSYSDNLLSPEKELKKLNAAWAEALSLPYAYLTTGGATAALRIAMAAVKGSVLVLGGAHVSVWNILKSRGGRHYFAKDVKSAREKLGGADISLVVATYPDYYGNAASLAETKALAMSLGAALLVDSSHGSHFALCDELPLSASQYADLVVYSLHKTLPVMTGGALVSAKPEYRDAISVRVGTEQSTSPSYAVIRSFEYALEEIKNFPKKYSEIFETLTYFKEDLTGTPFSVVKNDDPTRLVVESPFDSAAVAAKLEEAGIYCEAAGFGKLVFIVTPYNMKYLSYLAMTLKSITGLPPKKERRVPESDAVRVFDFDGRDFVLKKPSDAVGDRLYLEIGEYPPATPVWFYGDEVTEETVEYIEASPSGLFGLVNGRVAVIK